MRTFSWMLVIVALVVFAPPADAQTSHAAPQSALNAAVQEHAARADADRNTVSRLLERSDVRELADRLGLDVRRAQSAVTTLSGQELANLAGQARLVDGALTGGQSRITISTTAIIIALLLIILIVVAVD